MLIAGELDAVDAPVANAALFVSAFSAQLQWPHRPGRRRGACRRRLGHDFELVHAERLLAVCRAQAVGARVAAPNDDHPLAFGGDRNACIHRVPFAAPILLGQKLHRVMNAFQLPPRDSQVARMLSPAGQKDGIVMAGERFNRNVHSHMGIGDEGDAFVTHLLEPALDHVLL